VKRFNKLRQVTTLPSHVPQAIKPSMPRAALVLPVAFGMGFYPTGPHMAHTATGSTLGTQAETAAGDLTTGGGYVLKLVGYIFGAVDMFYGGYTIWQHAKNPNGQQRMSFGIISVLAGGFFLALSTMAQFSANTVSGGNATNTGTSQQLTIQ
jgi:hypothetical protein